MIRFIVRRVIPFIDANAALDIDTVERKDGYYLRVRVELLGNVIVDEDIKFSSQNSSTITKNEVLTLEKPLDFRKNKLGGNPFE